MTPAQLAERKRLYKDFEHYASRALKIRTKDQRVVPLKLNAAQKLILDAVQGQLERRGFVRLIILKGRQLGSSTFVEAFLYFWVSQRKAQKALVVAHDAPASTSIFAMTKRFHEQCPEILRPHTKYSSKKELAFDLLDSSYMVATAGGEGIARGETITAAHLSEAAWWPPSSAQDNHSGLMDCIPNIPGTFVFEESTANGFNQFYDHWAAAVKGESLFEPVFISWLLEEGYRGEVPADFQRTPNEEDLVAKYGMDDGQLMFRRQKIAERGHELFQREYPLSAEEAFLTSGRPVFHPERINELLQSAPEPIAQKALEADGTWQDHPRGELLCYREFDPRETYYLGADVGYGVRKDFSVAQVFDGQHRQVAVWRSDRHEAGYFGNVLAALGREYGNAHIACERNGPGILTNRVLSREEQYENLWQELVVDKLTDVETMHVGFLTNQKSKPLIIATLQGLIRGREIQIYDRTTLDELKSYIVTDTGKLQADEGKHDDCVVALAIAAHTNQGSWRPVEVSDELYVSIE